ncbi:MAG: tRNA adenosine(34) deaminase TadA [Succinivibrionaceae bacterium]
MFFEKTYTEDEFFMHEALFEAKKSWAKGEVPVGAVLVRNHEIIARGHNLMISLNDPTAHAEVMVIRNAGNLLKNYRLLDTTLYVTLEPCIMCCGAMVLGRIFRVVYGARDYKTGAIESAFSLLNNAKHNHQISFTSGILENECSNMLSSFFKMRREQKKALRA